MEELYEQKKLDEEDEMEGWERFRYNAKKRWATLRKTRSLAAVIAALSLLVIIMLVLLSQSHGRQRELAEQQRQSEEQIGRQWQIIEGLREQKKEEDAVTKDAPPVVTSDQIKAELGSIQELVTQQYIYTNADKIEQSETWIFGWDKPFSEKSLLVTYDGTIKAGVDLSEAEITVDEEDRTITVTLPRSRITDNIIPQETINILEVKNGLFNKVTFEDYNDLISSQKIIMENKAIARGLLDMADREAQAVVTSFLSAIPGTSEYKLTVVQPQD